MVASTRWNGGMPPAARNMPPSAVTRSSDMIAGFVSATRSRRVVVASARTGRHARTATATVAHQSAVAPGVGAGEHEEERARRRAEREPRERARLREPRSGRRPPEHDGVYGEDRQEELGVREMHGDPGVGELEQDRDRAEDGLQPEE